MTIHELCRRFGISPRTINTWRWRHGFPPPWGGRRYARYGREHVEWIEAWLAIRHNNAAAAHAVAHCRETGITLTQYVRQREAAIRAFGIGVA